jgi:hypothetical protein
MLDCLRSKSRLANAAGGFAEAFQQEIATKTDLAPLEQRLTIKIGAMLVAAIGVLLALEKLIK